ncbi:dihydrolipoamide acetyltransferase family protein [Arthrobacter antioxidans]|uniref:dihydrolipoamide acetyltransferase family protein n=1 Tax=Arthrobacter antioxidans TaxID=2895818 RepID=UPI001FFF4E10|nr:dihydrolipoamide acetyltransferase family protein [Arthrobacter antioxidans]
MTASRTTTSIREFRLPDLGEGLTESEIVQWHVAEGDTVELNQIIADVETAKAVVELPSPYAGVVVRLHEAAGSVVDVGAPIVSFEVAGSSGPDDVPAPPSATRGPVPAEPLPDGPVPARREPNLVGYGAAVEKGGRPQRRGRVLPAVGAPQPAAVQQPAASTPHPAALQHRERPRSTPPVRKLARDLGVSLDALTGTGPGALITRADVLAALAGTAGSPAGPAAAPASPGPLPARSSAGEIRTPIRGMRKHTAAAMVASAFSAPHATEFLTIDVTPTMELLAELRAGRAFEGTRVTPLTVVAKAVCIAIARNPTLNSSWDEQAQEIVQYADVNLGIAAATPRGLLVPNIKAAQALTLKDLAQALGALTETARAGRTPPADLTGGTLSITNIGVFGIDAGTPILNPGEAAILAMGAVRTTPWEYRGEIALRSVMTLSLSFDHRLVDGEQGSRFLADVGTILRNPAMVLAMV